MQIGPSGYPSQNTDDNATTLAPNDDWVAREALRTKNPGLIKTASQRKRYQELVDEQVRKDFNNYKPGSAAPPPSGPVTTTTVTAAQMSPDQIAAQTAWAYQTGTAITSPAMEPRVLRRMGPALPRISDYGSDPKAIGRTVALSAYSGEYTEKIKNPFFRDWMTKMAVVLGGLDPEQPGDLVSKGMNVWDMAGKMVAANPTVAKSMTPEEWLQQQYDLAGGDALLDKIKAATAPPNPITTERQVHTITITSAEAQAFVDGLSEQLLGRLASDAELKRARGSMQKLLTPTVSTTTRDATDPAKVQVTSHTKQGVSPQDAAGVLRMRMQRGSEGTAFRAGKMFEQALAKMA